LTWRELARRLPEAVMSTGNDDPATSGIRVLLVDPHARMRAALMSVLANEAGIAVVAGVGTVDEALTMVDRYRPQVALVDMAVFGDRGASGLGELRVARAQMAIIAMAVVDSPALEHAVVRQGAVGRVLKDSPPAELATAVRNAAKPARTLRVVPPPG
jgi:DNA-binding NarL/FixJ family response regulator